MCCNFFTRVPYLSIRSEDRSRVATMYQILTPRQRVVLAALAAERGASFAPVQVQKLFFLLDENAAEALGGKQFDFEPYDYGPFDRAVYSELEGLSRAGLVQVTASETSSERRQYSLTALGQEVGDVALENLPANVRDYAAKLSAWVRSLSFAELVGSIYRAYPEMKANSIFQD